MLFTSWEFLLFLAALFIVYYLIPKRFQWILLLAANVFFYVYAGWRGCIYISVTICSSYLISRRIESVHNRREQYFLAHRAELTKEEKIAYKKLTRRKTRKWLILCLVINFGILAVLKYANFAILMVNPLFAGADTPSIYLNLILPMGISFYTFQTMGYLIDLHRGKYPAERNIFKFALFVSFFPLLVQGPIARFDALNKTLYKPHDFDVKQISFGLQRMLWGYFKKVVIADRILVAVTALAGDPDTYQGVFVLCGMVFYALELYADFTGGIDITIGIAQVLGITVQENFNRPYFSKDIAEYWRRWHISLASWFREYLFYPIAASRPMLELSKKARAKLGNGFGKRLPVYVATIVVWFITGLWHGAAWNFIVWGLLTGLIIIISQEFMPLYARFHGRFPSLRDKFGYRLFQVLRTFFLMSSLRILDCYRDVAMSFRMFFSIFTKWNWGQLGSGALLKLGITAADYVIVGMGAAVLIAFSLVQRRGSVRERLCQKPYWLRYGLIITLLLVVLVFGAYGIGYDSSQFIYNQF
ncbi:MAG: MBOAT family protein [Eubacteriales bacterium]|nr:MBOAT family protein [Eubacteriales bacterium]